MNELENNNLNTDTNKHAFLLFGDDLRTKYAAEWLEKRGTEVFIYKDGEKESDRFLKKRDFDAVILPIPSFDCKENGICIRGSSLCLEKASRLFEKCTLVFSQKCENLEKCSLCDLSEDSLYSHKIALMTAQGTLAEIMKIQNEKAICQMKIAILGYGKCAKAIAEALFSLGARITVCARNESARKSALQKGYTSLGFDDYSLKKALANKDFIINTVPCETLSLECAQAIGKDCAYLEIASKCALDDSARALLSSRGSFHFLRALPNKYTPRSSGEILAERALEALERATKEEKSFSEGGDY